MRSELLVVLCGLSACGPLPTGTDAGTDAGTTIADAGSLGDAGTLVGKFQLQHIVSEFGDSASLLGKVYDGPTPRALVWSVALTNGDCRVEVPRAPFCATSCGGSAVCVEDDTCQAYPASNAVGTVHVSGTRTESGATEFDVSPIVNGYQQPAAVSLSLPPFTDGAAVTFSASGSSSVIPFTLTAPGVAAIAPTQLSYDLVSGTPLALQWTAGSSATNATIEVTLDISHHGGQRGELICETADDGELSIAADLVTKLIDLGVSGFPTITIRRVSRGSALIAAGRVDLEVISTTERGLKIPGLTSCTDDADCPSGQTCQNDLRCQ